MITENIAAEMSVSKAVIAHAGQSEAISQTGKAGMTFNSHLIRQNGFTAPKPLKGPFLDTPYICLVLSN